MRPPQDGEHAEYSRWVRCGFVKRVQTAVLEIYERHLIPDAGHNVPQEKPAAVIHAVLDLL